MADRTRSSIVIVGGGASGVLAAAHLLRAGHPDLRVTLLERRPRFGRGQAYSTDQPDHLLNVIASRMSAYADDPDHFWRWLQRSGGPAAADPNAFVPRRIYGEYLEWLLGDLEATAPAGRLRLLQEECIGINPTSSGVEIRLANDTSIAAHVAILALGHDQQPPPEFRFAVRLGSPEDTELAENARVLILGTGLSMIDTWLALDARGHRGEVTAVSRRGFLPQPHGPRNALRLDSADVPFGTELGYFVRWFRDLVRATERAGGDWRDVVDGLRPFNQRIWQSWPLSAKRRFLRHVKPWWDVRRHRIAPEIFQRVSVALAEGRLKIRAARVVEIAQGAGQHLVTLRDRYSRTLETLAFDRIYECTGLVRDISAGSLAVLRSLIERGLARPDPLRLGLEVTEHCAVVDAAGKAGGRLYAVGPLTRGTFFEIDAIPDIRLQCAQLAQHLVG